MEGRIAADWRQEEENNKARGLVQASVTLYQFNHAAEACGLVLFGDRLHSVPERLLSAAFHNGVCVMEVCAGGIPGGSECM